MIRLRDDKGNKIISIEKKGLLHLYLYLKGEKRPRKLGIIDELNKTFTVKRNPDDHTFYSTDSYGFNADLISVLPRDFIIIVLEKNRVLKLKTTVNDILEKGKYLYFVVSGLEKQIFLKKSLFSIFI